MPTPQNWIGPCPFVTLVGAPRRPTMRIEPFTRSGVDGTGFMLHGNAGRPFSLRSFADFANYRDAKEAMIGYTSLIGGGALPVMQDGLNWTSVGVMFVVLEVIETQIAACSGPGFLVATAGAYAEAEWLLVGVEF